MLKLSVKMLILDNRWIKWNWKRNSNRSCQTWSKCNTACKKWGRVFCMSCQWLRSIRNLHECSPIYSFPRYWIATAITSITKVCISLSTHGCLSQYNLFLLLFFNTYCGWCQPMFLSLLQIELATYTYVTVCNVFFSWCQTTVFFIVSSDIFRSFPDTPTKVGAVICGAVILVSCRTEHYMYNFCDPEFSTCMWKMYVCSTCMCVCFRIHKGQIKRTN